MPNTVVIDTAINTMTDNESSTDFSVMCIYEGVIINNPPVLTSPLDITVAVDGSYNLDPVVIAALVTDIEGDVLSKMKVVSTVGVGSLTYTPTVTVITPTPVPLIDNDVVDFGNIEHVKFTPIAGQDGFNYATLVLKFIDDGESPRCWSNDFTIIFHVTGANQEPTVSDHSIEVDNESLTVLTASFFTQNYIDPELDAFGHIVIHNIPSGNVGHILFQGTPVVYADLPLTVTAAQLNNQDLEYFDDGPLGGNNIISINFTVYDNVP